MFTHVRTTAVAAALAGALVLTGCSSGDSDGGGDSGKDKGKDSAGGTAQPSAPSGGGETKPGGVDGSWVSTTGGKTVVMAIDGKQVALAGEHVCTGTVAEQTLTLTLKCLDGNTDRTSGTLEAGDGETLAVSWSAGLKETFTRTGDQPGAGLPSDIPTELPSGFPTP
ncbi:hypothetical protein NLX86_27260 [Streptomyces sp. A3M-1-3]|uniref:hypothetical protein n=1 Tax=Streptomyces sp. A3M-1-3 TaxID=2962044 RepID=UPI0020B893BA|nr:hypothetical protein [Streptomyces sp. A3M-1-3]MCP3821658.1 hypothetical protein [Streptomyces sp. A3M-1-3]